MQSDLEVFILASPHESIRTAPLRRKHNSASCSTAPFPAPCLASLGLWCMKVGHQRTDEASIGARFRYGDERDERFSANCREGFPAAPSKAQPDRDGVVTA